MIDRQRKDQNWIVADEQGNLLREKDFSPASLAVLMDIRRELRTLNRIFGCVNFLALPQTVRAIQRNTAKPRKKKKNV